VDASGVVAMATPADVKREESLQATEGAGPLKMKGPYANRAAGGRSSALRSGAIDESEAISKVAHGGGGEGASAGGSAGYALNRPERADQPVNGEKELN